MISYDRIKEVLHNHLRQVTPSCYAMFNEDALINELDDLFAEAFEEGQRDPEPR